MKGINSLQKRRALCCSGISTAATSRDLPESKRGRTPFQVLQKKGYDRFSRLRSEPESDSDSRLVDLIGIPGIES
jgi:hypothetical protein